MYYPPNRKYPKRLYYESILESVSVIRKKMGYFPQELLQKVIMCAARESFRRLGPFITAGQGGKNVALTDKVLRIVNIDEFLVGGMVNETSIYRPFFVRCLDVGNITAVYVEGVRILAQTGPSHVGFSMLLKAAPHNVYASLALGLFFICCGNSEQGNVIVYNVVVNKTAALEEAVQMGDTILMQVSQMGTPGRRPYGGLIRYPGMPYCGFLCRTTLGVCRHCYALVFASRLSVIC